MTKLAFVFGFAVGQASLPNCAVGHEGAGRDSRRCGESGGCGRRVGKGEAEAAGEISDLMSSLNGRKKCEHDPRKNTVLARTAGAPPSASTTERGASAPLSVVPADGGGRRRSQCLDCLRES